MAEAQPELLVSVLDDLTGPPLPPLAERAWDVFGRLSATRQSGMHGVGPITYGEMAAFQDLSGVLLSPLDVELIREADSAFLAFAMERFKQAAETDAASETEDDAWPA